MLAEPFGCEQTLSTHCFDEFLAEILSDLMIPIRVLQTRPMEQYQTKMSSDSESGSDQTFQDQSQFKDIPIESNPTSNYSFDRLIRVKLNSDVLCLSGKHSSFKMITIINLYYCTVFIIDN